MQIAMSIAAVVGIGLAESQSDPNPGPIIALVVVIVLITFVISLLLGVVVNSITTRAELGESFSDAFKVSELIRYSKATAGRVIIKTILFGFVAMGLSMLGLLLFFVGIYAVAVVLQFAQLNLRWQIYDEYLNNGGEPLPLKDVQLPPSQGGYAPSSF